jgi:nitrogenase molybdenum-cofactor synthesis protein NifE
VLLEKFGTPYIITNIPIGTRATDTFLEKIRSALSLSSDRACQVGDLPLLDPSLHIAIFSGPTRAIALSRFLSDLSCPPRLIVLDFPPPSHAGIEEAAGNGCRILIEPSFHEIQKALAEENIGLILGGMLERPVAALLGIRLIDMMHGSQRTVGYEGARILAGMISKAKD